MEVESPQRRRSEELPSACSLRSSAADSLTRSGEARSKRRDLPLKNCRGFTDFSINII